MASSFTFFGPCSGGCGPCPCLLPCIKSFNYEAAVAESFCSFPCPPDTTNVDVAKSDFDAFLASPDWDSIPCGYVHEITHDVVWYDDGSGCAPHDEGGDVFNTSTSCDIQYIYWDVDGCDTPFCFSGGQTFSYHTSFAGTASRVIGPSDAFCRSSLDGTKTTFSPLGDGEFIDFLPTANSCVYPPDYAGISCGICSGAP